MAAEAMAVVNGLLVCIVVTVIMVSGGWARVMTDQSLR